MMYSHLTCNKDLCVAKGCPWSSDSPMISQSRALPELLLRVRLCDALLQGI